MADRGYRNGDAGMDTKEAEILDYILHNGDQTLTTDRIAAHLSLSAEDVHNVIDELEDQLLVTVDTKTADRYYDIRPTLHAQEEFLSDPLIHLGPTADSQHTQQRPGQQA